MVKCRMLSFRCLFEQLSTYQVDISRREIFAYFTRDWLYTGVHVEYIEQCTVCEIYSTFCKLSVFNPKVEVDS